MANKITVISGKKIMYIANLCMFGHPTEYNQNRDLNSNYVRY